MTVKITYIDEQVKREVTIINASDDVIEKLYTIEDQLLPDLKVSIRKENVGEKD